ncbi:hypothetical protein SNEBB_004960 [Seison nebaliae]|nr:hypothetical protein SNEBB_004960 [Seison nebaliae]
MIWFPFYLYLGIFPRVLSDTCRIDYLDDDIKYKIIDQCEIRNLPSMNNIQKGEFWKYEGNVFDIKPIPNNSHTIYANLTYKKFEERTSFNISPIFKIIQETVEVTRNNFRNHQSEIKDNNPNYVIQTTASIIDISSITNIKSSNLIINGKIISSAKLNQTPNFGILPNTSILFGYLSDSQLHSFNFLHLFSTFAWIISDGRNLFSNNSNKCHPNELNYEKEVEYSILYFSKCQLNILKIKTKDNLNNLTKKILEKFLIEDAVVIDISMDQKKTKDETKLKEKISNLKLLTGINSVNKFCYPQFGYYQSGRLVI